MSDSEFLVMGTCVSFRYEPEGEKRAREIDAPVRYGLIHCASGSAWPRCVLMVGPWTRGKVVEDNEISLAARKFLRTDDYEPHAGQFQAPSVDAGSWKLLGELRKIWYLRQGALDYYLKHDFKRRQFLIFPAKTLLFRSSRWWKVKMPGTCVINDRGIVNP